MTTETLVFGNRRLCIIGTSGHAEYATDQRGTLWYRFTSEPRLAVASWYVVSS